MFFIVRHEPLGRAERARPTTPRVPVIFGHAFETRTAARTEAQRRFQPPWHIVEAEHLGQVLNLTDR